MAERAYTYGDTSYYDRYISSSSSAYEQAPAVAEEKKKAKKKAGILDNPGRLMIIAFSLIVVGFFVILFRTSIISSMNAQVIDMTDKLNVYYSQNEQGTVILDRTTDLNYVEDVAKNHLNMDVPKAEQKVYVDVKISDTAEIPVKEEKGFFAFLKKLAYGCMEYLY